MMGIANKLTLLRLILIPVMVILMLCGEYLWAAIVFIVAGITDIADGRLARKLGQITTFGIFFDPLADKMLVYSAIILFVEQGTVPGWTLILIFVRELAVAGLRMLAAEKKIVIAAAKSGKLKTLTQDIAVAGLLLAEGLTFMPDWFGILALIVYYVSVAIGLWSGAEYFMKNTAAFKEH